MDQRPLRLKIASHPANLADVRRQVEASATAGGFDEKAVGDVGLCVNEALANVIRHAYGGATDRPIEIAVEWIDGAMRISIRDWGNGVNPLERQRPRRDPLRPGGVGLICLKELLDEVEFRRQSDGMLLVMTRRRGRREQV